MLAEHVWEHLDRNQGLLAAKHCYRYLRAGGYLRIAVPDGFHPDRAYVANVKPGGAGSGAKDHKVLYDYLSLTKLLEEAGLCVRPLEYFDECGQFHYVAWNPDDGMVVRSRRFDERNVGGALHYSSLIVDAEKV